MKAIRLLSEVASLIRRDSDVQRLRSLIRNCGSTGRFSLIGPESEGSGWRRRALHEIADAHCSPKLPPERLAPGDWVLDLEDIESDTGRLLARMTARDRGSLSNKAGFLAGDVLYGKLRPYLNKVLVADRPGFCSTEIVPLRAAEDLDPRYLQLALTAPSFLSYANQRSYGMKMPRLGTEDLDNAEILTPPLAEQCRIVAKVDELMALCDRLEAQLQERDARSADLATAAVAKFSAEPTVENLEYLFHPSVGVVARQLRQTIVSLALQGKLFSDADSVALNDSGVACARGGSQTEEVPYKIPDHWKWSSMGQLAVECSAGWSPQCLPEPRSGDNWGVLKVSAVSWGVFDPCENKALPAGMDGRPECEVTAGDFLLSRANTDDLVARSVVVGECPPRLMMSDKIVRFRFKDCIDPRWINLANTSLEARAYYARNASGTSESMKNVSRKVMRDLPVPVPSLAEQRRIIAKVDELMALVDQLESQITASEESRTKLLDSLIAELAPSN